VQFLWRAEASNDEVVLNCNNSFAGCFTWCLLLHIHNHALQSSVSVWEVFTFLKSFFNFLGCYIVCIIKHGGVNSHPS